jgi:hypothetical protein
MRKLNVFLVLIIRTATVVLCLSALNGCFGDYKLIVVADQTSITGWHQYVTPRPPQNPIEKIVVRVAQTRENEATADLDILFIVTDFTKKIPVQLVDVVIKTSSEEPFPERKVTRYRIIDGKVAAMSDPSVEFYVDANLERAILRAVAKTFSPERVLIYNDGTRTLTITSHSINKCTAEIKIYNKEGLGDSALLAEKNVAFCFVN